MFEKGNTLGQGRKPGTRSKFSKKFIEAVAADFEEYGKDVIIVLRMEDPAAYIRTCVSLVPKDFQLTGADGEPLFKGIALERVTAKSTDS